MSRFVLALFSILCLAGSAYAAHDFVNAPPVVETPEVRLADRGFTSKATMGAAELFAPTTTGAIITMASSAAAQTLGNTAATGADLAKSITDSGMISSLAAGTFTVSQPGTFELYYSGQITGEEDEDVTLIWQLDGANIAACTSIVEFDATTQSALVQPIAKRCLASGSTSSVFKLTVLGGNDEVITFKGFNFGVRRVASPLT